VAGLGIATGRNFSMSGIILGHHNLPTYEMALKSDNVEFVCGIVVAILKMATGRNFSMSGHHYLPTYQILMISKFSRKRIRIIIIKIKIIIRNGAKTISLQTLFGRLNYMYVNIDDSCEY